MDRFHARALEQRDSLVAGEASVGEFEVNAEELKGFYDALSGGPEGGQQT